MLFGTWSLPRRRAISESRPDARGVQQGRVLGVVPPLIAPPQPVAVLRQAQGILPCVSIHSFVFSQRPNCNLCRFLGSPLSSAGNTFPSSTGPKIPVASAVLILALCFLYLAGVGPSLLSCCGLGNAPRRELGIKWSSPGKSLLVQGPLPCAPRCPVPEGSCVPSPAHTYGSLRRGRGRRLSY